MALIPHDELIDRAKCHIEVDKSAKVIQFFNANKVAKIIQNPSIKELI